MIETHATLTPHDLESLKASFITPEIAKAASLRRVGDQEGAETVGRRRNAGSDYAGILFPYFQPPDFQRPREYRLRRDNPDYESNGNGVPKEKAKYLTPPGRSNMLYTPPDVKETDLKSSALPIVITEGEKKTLALFRLSQLVGTAERFLPIGMIGVWGFRGKVGKTTRTDGSRADVKGIIPDFDQFVWRGRSVSILFDANVQTNESVKAARMSLAKDLTGRGAVVQFIDLPPDCGVNGVDDFLGRVEREHGQDAAVEAGLQLLETAVEPNSLKRLKTTRLSDVVAKPVDWLWRPFFACGIFNLIDGEEGIGKTFLMLKAAAAIASGRALPNVEPAPPANVLLISAEDSLPFVIKPRLEAMGAPCERIIAIEEIFTFDTEGFFRLSLAMSDHQPKLAIIDPLFSRVGGINLNNDNEIRTITDQLNRLAEKHNCAIVGVRHINKSKGFGDPRNAGLNGVGWRAGARTHSLVGRDPKDKTKLAIVSTKSNLGPDNSTAIGFRISDGVCEWTGESDLTAEMMLSYKHNESVEDRGAKKDAIDFLQKMLAGGRIGSQSIIEAATQAGISKRTLDRAKSELGIRSEKDSAFIGGWYWELPELTKVANEDCQIDKVGNLRASCASKGSYSNGLAEDCQLSDSGNLLGNLGNLGDPPEEEDEIVLAEREAIQLEACGQI
jgi:hypothetical protein